MENIDAVFDNQTLMEVGIYSFLDNLLNGIHSSAEEDHLQQTPSETSLTVGEASTNELTSMTTSQPFLLSSLVEPDSFLLRRLRIQDHLTELETDESGPTSILSNESGQLNVDELISSTESPKAKPDIIAGGYNEDLFLYLSDVEKEELTCLICYSIIKQAYQCKNEHRFCYGCIYVWSAGNGSGHSQCPMCRCDGLYAMNEELDKRIGSKRIRCQNDNCNWIGFLCDYTEHGHRVYEPRELNIFGKSLSSSEKLHKNQKMKFPNVNNKFDFCDELIIPSVPVRLPQSFVHSSIIEPIQVRYRSASILGETEEPRGLNSGSEQENRFPLISLNSNFNRLTPITSNPSVIRSNALGQNNLRQGELDRLSLETRDTRHNQNGNLEFQSIQRLETALPHRLPSLLPILLSEETQPPSGRSVPSIANVTTHESLPRRLTPVQTIVNSQPSMNLLPTSCNYQRASPSINSVNCSNLFTTVSRLPNIYQHDEHLSTDLHTGLPLTNTVETIESTLQSNIIPTLSQQADPSLILPHLNSGAAYARTTRNLNRISPLLSETMTEANRNDHAGQSVSQQLIYRRLVPRRRNYVLDQLRETREQLTTMLSLMTTELEERRQHVLNAAYVAARANQLLMRAQTGDSRSIICRPTDVNNRHVDTSNIRDFSELETHSILRQSISRGRNFSIQHLNRLHRIEILLNEIHGSADSELGSSMESDYSNPTMQQGRMNTTGRDTMSPNIENEGLEGFQVRQMLGNNYASQYNSLSAPVWSSDDELS